MDGVAELPPAPPTLESPGRKIQVWQTGPQLAGGQTGIRVCPGPCALGKSQPLRSLADEMETRWLLPFRSYRGHETGPKRRHRCGNGCGNARGSWQGPAARGLPSARWCAPDARGELTMTVNSTHCSRRELGRASASSVILGNRRRPPGRPGCGGGWYCLVLRGTSVWAVRGSGSSR